jgi:hypothetical protein
LVTTTFTAPAACAGVVAVICVPLATTTFVAGVPPNVTVAPVTKFVPVMLTAVPPVVGPLLGLTLLTVGAATYVNPLVRLPLCVSGLVTTTFTAPAACAGVVAVIWLVLTTTTFVAVVPPNVTVAPVTKFVPVMVTAVPPAVGPLLGLTLVTVGAVGDVYVNPLVNVPVCVSGLVTTTFTAPAACAGVVAVICVPLTTTTFVAPVPPNVTVAPVTKFVPVMLTAVPPAPGPLLGLTPVTVGAGDILAALNATICITQAPDGLNGAVAL